MSLSPLEAHILAHYLVHGATGLNIVERAYPRGELPLVVEDKMKLGTLEYGIRDPRAHANAALAFVDTAIARGGFSTIDSPLGGSMHRLQVDTWRPLIAELADADPIVAQARAQGEGFWGQAFTGLAS